MNRRINFTQLKGLFFVKGLLAILLAAPVVATAAGTGTATLDDIKDTNYPVPSGAYFVSPDGKDTNTGKSYNSPWSVAKVIKSAPVGSTIVFKGGIYRNVDLGINRKLTLQAYPHEKPLLKGSVEVTGWVADGTTWRKDGWNYSFPQTVGSQYIDPSYPMAGYGDMVYIDGVALKQVASKAEVVPGAFYVDSANQALYIGNNPADKTVEATALPEALTMWKSSSSNPSGTVIRGLGFAHYARRALRVGAPDVKLENNTFVWNGENGVWFFHGSDSIVRGNISSYNGRSGMWGGYVNRILLERNTISYNNVERFAKTWDAAGAKFVWTDGITIRNNIVENNFANGIWLDESIINATVVNNTVRNNELIGIFYELSHKAILAANIVYKNVVGIMVSDSSSVRVYNNTLSMNNANIVVKDTPRKNTDSKEFAAGITWVTRDNVIKNNILSDAQQNGLLASDCSTYQRSSSMIANTNYNAYYRPSSSEQKNLFKWSLGSSQCSVTYTSLATFNSATGFEANSLAIDNVATNPFFVDEANEDFHLKLDSPAIGRGEPLPSDIASVMRLPSGVKVDLGALQATQY